MLSPVTTVDTAVGALIGCWKENNIHNNLVSSNVTKFFLIHVAYSQQKIKSQLIGKKKLGSGTFSVGWSVAATAN